jgi:hypothetical protein
MGDGQRVVEGASPDPLESTLASAALNGAKRGDTGVEPDVLLDVPTLNVASIKLGLDDLTAHVALKAEILDLVKLSVGVDAHLGKVDLDIEGVEAQALLKVRLGHVVAMVDRALTTIDRNPELLTSVSRVVEDVGSGTKAALEGVGGGTKAALEGVGTGTQHALREVAEHDAPRHAGHLRKRLPGIATRLTSRAARVAAAGLGAAVGAHVKRRVLRRG